MDWVKSENGRGRVEEEEEEEKEEGDDSYTRFSTKYLCRIATNDAVMCFKMKTHVRTL